MVSSCLERGGAGCFIQMCSWFSVLALLLILNVSEGHYDSNNNNKHLHGGCCVSGTVLSISF